MVPISEIANCPARIEERSKKVGLMGSKRYWPALDIRAGLGSAAGVNATLCSRSPSHGLSDPSIYG
jgi:hypothetical protein